jgi:hypothetical protein
MSARQILPRNPCYEAILLRYARKPKSGPAMPMQNPSGKCFALDQAVGMSVFLLLFTATLTFTATQFNSTMHLRHRNNFSLLHACTNFLLIILLNWGYVSNSLWYTLEGNHYITTHSLVSSRKAFLHPGMLPLSLLHLITNLK